MFEPFEYTSRPSECFNSKPLVLYENYTSHSVDFVCFVIFWKLLECKWAPRFLQRFVPQYHTMDEPRQQQWHVRFVSTVFSCCIVPSAIYCVWYDPALQHSPLNGTSSVSRFTAHMAFSYFLWDIWICIQYYSDYGFSFLFHGLFCALAYLIITFPQCMMKCGFSALLYEASTPFLNARWCLRDINMHRTNTWHYANVLFAIVFVIVRVCFGTWLIHVVIQSASTDSCVPLWIRILSVIIITASYILNGYWTVNIAKNAIKHSKKTAKKE